MRLRRSVSDGVAGYPPWFSPLSPISLPPVPHADNLNRLGLAFAEDHAPVADQYFVYNASNRLLGAEENPRTAPAVYPASFACTSGVSWCEGEGYDIYGNRQVGTATGWEHPRRMRRRPSLRRRTGSPGARGYL